MEEVTERKKRERAIVGQFVLGMLTNGGRERRRHVGTGAWKIFLEIGSAQGVSVKDADRGETGV